jgi:hypothetical protein
LAKVLGGLPKDEREAAKLYRLAADQGLPRLSSTLGYSTRKAAEVLSKNFGEARRLVELAAAQGLIEAQRLLAALDS